MFLVYLHSLIFGLNDDDGNNDDNKGNDDEDGILKYNITVNYFLIAVIVIFFIFSLSVVA